MPGGVMCQADQGGRPYKGRSSVSQPGQDNWRMKDEKRPPAVFEGTGIVQASGEGGGPRPGQIRAAQLACRRYDNGGGRKGA